VLWTVACAGLACSDSDPCGDATTCVRLEVDAFSIQAIDQLLLDVVYDGHHATTVTGTLGTAIELPLDLPLTFNVPGNQIDVDLVAAGKLGGQVVGADATSLTVQSGTHSHESLFLLSARACTEGALYCGGTSDIIAESQSLYRCTGSVPIFYARCSFACTPHFDSGAVCAGSALCRDGGTYCGGHNIDGDPNTLYVCASLRGTNARPCTNGCAIIGDGTDACR
jgi:hypothetical protein